MQRDRPTLDIVLHDEESGARVTLSLLSVADQRASFAGTLLEPESALIVAAGLAISADAALSQTGIDDEGIFGVEADGEREDFSYLIHAYQTASPYRILQADLKSQVTGAKYSAFTIDDPFPLLLVAPIGGAVAGVTWLWRRHKNRDKAAIEVIQGSVNQALAEGRSVDIHEEANSKVRLPGGTTIDANSTFDVHIGERPAA